MIDNIKMIILWVLDHLSEIRTKRKIVVFKSDDWGSVRIRSKEDQKELIKKGLKITNRFDQYDSLETNDDLEMLFEVLTKYKDQYGNHPVITAVTNVANPDFTRIQDSAFKEYFFETIDRTYQRYPDSDRVMRLVQEGIRNKIFIPQSHGREHVQVNWWMRELSIENSPARKYFENEFFFIPSCDLLHTYRNRDLSAAFDVLDKNDLEVQKEIIYSGLDIFEQLFRYKSTTFTPPAMFYSPSIEISLFQKGIKWLDVGRIFKVPMPDGSEKWQVNYLGRKKKSGLKVLVRNAMFEPNISETDNGVSRCLYDIERAFSVGQPAIISNHRVSFIGRLDVSNRNKGLRALNMLLSKIVHKWPEVEFLSTNDIVHSLK